MKSLYLLLLPILLMVASCAKETEMTPIVPQPVEPPPPNDSAKISSLLALGDSYTIGQSVTAEERFPNQTTVLLAGDNLLFTKPHIIAQTGWTTDNLLNTLNRTPPPNAPYDIVTLLIGVNNQYQRLSPNLYKDEFTLLLNKAIGYAGNKKTRVFVLSIPDYSVAPFGNNEASIAKEIDLFNAINKEVTVSFGCTYIDITGSTREAKTDRSLVAGDGLHPSGKEYRKWALLLYPLIKVALQ